MTNPGKATLEVLEPNTAADWVESLKQSLQNALPYEEIESIKQGHAAEVIEDWQNGDPTAVDTLNEMVESGIWPDDTD